ncbi:MAG TPA: carboxypeptidase-like regulatory domain-containing protein [Terriglobia bacterium]|nr:carboxypeptidase-like regulatory domain-containing protein [Terriglobia bacterium]
MVFRRFVLALLFVQVALPQAGRNGSIQGVVINEYSGQPYTEASVELMGVQQGRVLSRTVRTDANGAFRFGDVPPGMGYHLVVTGDRLQPTAHGQRNWNEPWVPFNLEPGENLGDIKISVQPLAAIRGRILDNQGRGLMGARVVALRPTWEPRRVLEASSTQVTNSRGEYQFLSIPAGTYYIRVTPSNSDSAANIMLSSPSRVDQSPQNARLVDKDPEGYPVTYFPSTLHVASAKPVNLPAGGTANDMDITVTRIRTGRVRGTVTRDGKPVNAGQVLLHRHGTASDSNWSRLAEINDEGQFDLRGVIPGSFTLWTRVGESDQRLWGRTTVEVQSGETSTVPVKVGMAPDIGGRLSVEGWTEAAEPDFTRVSVFLVPDGLRPVDASLQRLELNMPSRTAAVSSDGRFTFRGVAPWDYQVIVSPTTPGASLGRIYAKTVRLNAADLLAGGLHVAPGLEGQMDITLALDSGGLDGRILDADRGNPETSRIVLVPDDRDRHDRYLAVRVSTSGRFQIQGIAPGKYKVFAWKEAPPGAWYDPDFLQNYEDRAVAVEIEPGVGEYLEMKWFQ